VYATDPEDINFVRGTATAGSLSGRSAAKLRALAENKWKEYKYIEQHAPGALPKTENLQAVLKSLKINKLPKASGKRLEMLQALETELKKRYRNGFILKPTDGSQSAGIFPSEKHNFQELYTEYKNQGLDKKLRGLNKSDNWDRDWARLRSRPGFAGRVLDEVMRNPSRVIVQHKLPLENVSLPGKIMSTLTNRPMTKELRVHVVNGRVVPDLVSSRYFHPLRGITDRKMFDEAGHYAQNIVDRLPKHQRGNFAMDVAPLQGGGFTLIESNPGGASGMLHPENSPLNAWRLRKAMTGSYGPAAAATGALAGAAVTSAVAGGVTTFAAPYIKAMMQPPPEPESPTLPQVPPQLPPPMQMAPVMGYGNV
jgi:hypothetical protein